jgi:hypothetical protein
MSDTEYTKVFEGNFILVTRIKDELTRLDIIPIIKDEGESQRLAGYASMNQGWQELYVHNDELDKAKAIVAQVKAELETE